MNEKRLEYSVKSIPLSFSFILKIWPSEVYFTMEMTTSFDKVLALIFFSLALLIIIITVCCFCYIIIGTEYMLRRQNQTPAVLYTHHPEGMVIHGIQIDQPLTMRPMLPPENRSTVDATSK